MNEVASHDFAFLVLDFDEELKLTSGACVGRGGEAVVSPFPIGARIDEFLWAGETTRLGPLIEAAIGGKPSTIKLTDRRDGSDRTFSFSLLPRRVVAGQQGLVLTIQDITEAEGAVSRLKAVEDRLRAILDHAADAIVVIGVEGRIEGVNAAAERLTGWNEAELKGQPIEQLMGQPYRDRHRGWLEGYLVSGVSGILNVGPRPLPLLHRSGRTVPIELSVGEAVVAGERKFVGVCRDISQRLETEEALRTANGRLVAKLQELEALSSGLRDQKQALEALAREAEAALASAESANQAKSRFVATMSHELRTPLNGILAVADALSRRDLEDKDLEFVRIIQSSGKGLLSILNEVLDLARVESGALRLDPRPFSPAEVVTAVAEVWRFAAEAKGLALQLNLGRLPEAAIGDAGRLRQVLSNLVNNAIKFTESGTVTLAARRVGRSGVLRFEVTDSGPGIDEAHQDRLFEPFVQADAGITRKHGGTGLGLAICRQLITLMGGRIWAENVAPRGARMICELAFRRAANTPGDEVGDGDLDDRASAVRESDPLILVAEDHPLNRRVASILLEEAGLRFEFAEDGRAAVEAVKSGRFDIVLMDVHMPEMDGLEAARAIRRLPGEAAAVPIIAVTANASREEADQCRLAGMDDVVAKPIDAAQLLQRIADHL